MKRIVASLAVLSLGMSSTVAADLPQPMLPLLAPPLWTGFHVGLNAGYAWPGSARATTTTVARPAPVPQLFVAGLPVTPALLEAIDATTSFGRSGAGGFIGGGQLGYDYVFGGNFLIGAEADFQGAIGGSGDSAAYTTLTTLHTHNRLDYLGTARARLGWLATPTLLVYATVGAAYGGPSSTTQIFQRGVGAFGGYGSGAVTSTRFGWTAGGGAEWMFLPNWSAKMEYLFYDLGSVSNTLVAAGDAFDVATGVPFAFPTFPYAYMDAKTTTRIDGHVVRAGLNYHFNWAPAAAKF